MELFSERLKKARKAKKMKVSDLTAAAGITAANYSPYEREENPRLPSVVLAAKFAQILNVSLDYLTGLSDETKIIKVPVDEVEEKTVTRAEFEKQRRQIEILQGRIAALESKI
jgi:transcriptional regulator with XRE-family HTH domain